MDKQLLSLREVAKRTGISTSRLRRLAANGTLRATKAGSYWVVSAEDIDDFMQLARPHGVKASARRKIRLGGST